VVLLLGVGSIIDGDTKEGGELSHSGKEKNPVERKEKKRHRKKTKAGRGQGVRCHKTYPFRREEKRPKLKKEPSLCVTTMHTEKVQVKRGVM